MNETYERDFKGVWIPREIWLDPNLSILEKCLLVEIDSLDNDPEMGCFASNEYLSKFIKKSEGRTANIISDLRKRGYITNCFWDGRNRGLRIVKRESSIHENVKAEFTKTLTLRSRKREHSNTDSNTDYNTIKKEENSDDKFKGLPPEEVTIQKALEAGKAFFEMYPAMLEIMPQNAKILPDDPNFNIFEQLEKWIRLNVLNVSILTNVSKNIPGSFQNYLGRYNQFKPKNKIQENGKSRQNRNLISEETARKAFAALREND